MLGAPELDAGLQVGSDESGVKVQQRMLRILSTRSQSTLWTLETVSLPVAVSRDRTIVHCGEPEFSAEPEAVAAGTWEVARSRSEATCLRQSRCSP